MEASKATQETAGKQDAAIRQWRDAKFDIFIHSGLYSILAGVWKGRVPAGTDDAEDNTGGYAEHIGLKLRVPMAEYTKPADQFNPMNASNDGGNTPTQAIPPCRDDDGPPLLNSNCANPLTKLSNGTYTLLHCNNNGRIFV